jgi:Protein of unknown function (DUF3313)
MASFRSLRFAGTLAALAWFASCAATEQTTSAKPAGFLGDYTKLKPGKEGEAQLIYIAKDADVTKYDSIMLESVSFWVAKESDYEKLDKETAQSITDRLYKALYDRLAKDYKMVAKPGPNVLRIRAAITGAQDARVVGNALTTIVPQLRLLSQLGDLDNDTAFFVGKAAVECELLDSATGKQLAAAVDERMGNKSLKTAFTNWGDVDAAIDFWANRMGDRLAKLRKGDRSPLEP